MFLSDTRPMIKYCNLNFLQKCKKHKNILFSLIILSYSYSFRIILKPGVEETLEQSGIDSGHIIRL